MPVSLPTSTLSVLLLLGPLAVAYVLLAFNSWFEDGDDKKDRESPPPEKESGGEGKSVAQLELVKTTTTGKAGGGGASAEAGASAPGARSQKPAKKKKKPGKKLAQPLEWKSKSVLELLRLLAQLGVVLAYIYVCEHHPPYAHGGKTWDRDTFWFMFFLLLLVASTTLHKSKTTDLLGREQSEEWKGWMQFLFLMYHYYHASEVYNLIRVLITAYVWMTGFGNFSFFYIKRDFGSVRMMQMLWRLNFLVTCLCLTMDNSYILYYICPLHTFFFLVVYCIMRVKSDVNHTKWGIRLKLLVAGVAVFCVWDLQVFGQLFAALNRLWLSPDRAMCNVGGQRVPCPVGGKGGLWEWYFRTFLDHWSTFLGMCFALNFPVAQRWLAAVECLPAPRQWAVKASVGLPLALAAYWWATEVFTKPKLEYNATHAYYGWIPMLAYIYFRNISVTFRQYHLGLLHRLGKVTLETYLLQHHVWLTSNAKSLLILIPDAPLCNMLLVTCLYVFVSNQMYRLTMSLRGMLLPNDAERCVRNTAAIAAALVSAYAAAVALKTFGLGANEIIALVVAGGILLASALVRTLPRERGDASPDVLSKLLGPAVTVVAAAVIISSMVSRMAAPNVVPASQLKPIPAGRVIGSLAKPTLGAFVLAVATAMLFGMDIYAGLSHVALKVVSGKSVSWKDSYGPLHASIGV